MQKYTLKVLEKYKMDKLKKLEKDFYEYNPMGFDSEEDYKTYQSHPIHLGLKKAAGNYIAGPPVTYDFWTE